MDTRLLVPIGVLLSIACSGEKPATEAPPAAAPPATSEAAAAVAAPLGPVTLLRGTVHTSPSLNFLACDGGSLAAVLDSTGGRLLPAYSLLRATEDNGLYVQVRAVQAPSGELIIRQVEFAGVPGAGAGCEQPAPDYVVMARGVNPVWQLAVSELGLEFTQAAEPATMSFAAAAPADSAGAAIYQSTADGGHTLHLVLSTTGCSQGRAAGASYTSMRADLTIDGKTLTGCAWRGRLP